MGMLLRRKNRPGEYVPQVNGQPVKVAPKKKSLTAQQPTTRPTSNR